MPTFEAWDVVKVPFPYTDRPVRQHRPALVVAAGGIEAAHGLLWVLMITSAENRRWGEDIAISDPASAGLPAASVVRCAKIATVDSADAERIGSLPRADRKEVAMRLANILPAASPRPARR
jgi:mRNA interferase MazF